MQLTHPASTLTVDFYPVKFVDGTINSRQVLKIVTFMGGTQSKSMINKRDMEREVDSRLGYGYEVTDFHVIPQLYNSGLCCACVDTVKTYPLFSELHSMTISKADHFTLVENYVNHIVDGMDTDSLAAMVVDLLTREYENVPVDEIKEEILDLYDEETLNDLML